MRAGGRLLRLTACVLATGCAVSPAFAAATDSVAVGRRPDTSNSPSPASWEDSLVVAMLAVHARVPAELLRRGPGLRRLLRERLAHDPGVPLPAEPGTFAALLPDGGRLPIAAVEAAPACPQCVRDPARVLLDAVASSSEAIARGSGGLQLELRDLAWTRDVRTTVVGRQRSACVAGRRQVGNPEFERLKVRLVIALADRQQAEEDSRNEDGLLGLLATLSASARGGEVKRLSQELEQTPPFTWEEVVEPYDIDVTEARASGTLSGRIVLSDAATGWRDTLDVAGAAERRAGGLSGVRPGDTRAHTERDAVALLPAERDLFALAFDDLGERARVPLERMAARAALRRAAREQDRGRGGEALGWLLLARDCGEQPPASSGWQAALARANAAPYARLADVRLRPFRAPVR